MAIKLDGSYYSVFQSNYQHAQSKHASMARSITGDIVRIDSGVFQNSYQLTLICNTSEILTLRTSFAKSGTDSTAPTTFNKLDFIDEEGKEWNPTTGTGVNNTGVYFTSLGTPKPMNTFGWTDKNRFLVDITLVVNSKGISS